MRNSEMQSKTLGCPDPPAWLLTLSKTDLLHELRWLGGYGTAVSLASTCQMMLGEPWLMITDDNGHSKDPSFLRTSPKPNSHLLSLWVWAHFCQAPKARLEYDKNNVSACITGFCLFVWLKGTTSLPGPRVSVAIAVNLRRVSGKGVYTMTLPFSIIVPLDLPRAPDSIDLHCGTPVFNTNFMLSEASSGNTFG